MTSTFTKIKRLSEGEMSDFSDSVKFDPNYKLNYVIYIMDLRLQGKKMCHNGYKFVRNREEMFLKLFGGKPEKNFFVMFLGHLQYAKADTGLALGQWGCLPFRGT